MVAMVSVVYNSKTMRWTPAEAMGFQLEAGVEITIKPSGIYEDTVVRRKCHCYHFLGGTGSLQLDGIPYQVQKGYMALVVPKAMVYLKNTDPKGRLLKFKLYSEP